MDFTQIGQFLSSVSSNIGDFAGANKVIIIANVVLVIGIAISIFVNLFTSNEHAPSGGQAQRVSRKQKLGITIFVLAIVDIIFTTVLLSFNSPAPASAAIETNPYPPRTGTLVVKNDPLKNNLGGYGLEETNFEDKEICGFKDGTYHVTERFLPNYKPCHFKNVPLLNFTFEVKMTILQGNCGGISARDDEPGKAYSFVVCQDGTYIFYRFDNLSTAPELTRGKSAAIKRGLNQTNTLALVANEATFDVYVNSDKIASIADTYYHKGPFGVVACDYNRASPTEVSYTDARVWTL